MGAKMKAKKFKDQMVVVPMSEEDVQNMKMVIRLKFDQYPVLKSKLKISGLHTIVENIGNRKGERHLFWGMKKADGIWEGNNQMGKLLMELREEYLKEGKNE
jgi:predicted NAD-dependent protein-ADP-ribosyltransferase YbiA (DUF1768 family)